MSDVRPLWKHQEIAVARASALDDLALFFEMGTGKTRTTIEILRGKYNGAKRIMRTLVFGPIIVTAQWKAEFAKFSKVPQEKIAVLTGSRDQRLRKFKQMQASFGDDFIAIVNYEGLLIKELYETFLKWAPEVIILDESQRCKDSTTKRFKALLPLCEGAKHRYLLTGTPVLNSALDLYAQYRLMDLGRTFGRNFFAFRATYFYDKNAGMPRHKYFPGWTFRTDTTKIFHEKLSSTSVQARKEECLDLPPLIEIPLDVEMGSAQKKAYDEMKRQFVTLVKEKAVTAQLAITQSIRMRQILSGFAQPEHIPGEDAPKPVEFDDVPRLDALKDLLTDLLPQQHKIIVWTNYRHCYKMIAKALGETPHVMLTGEQTNSEKTENVERFCRGDAQVAICNPAAVGLGVNLTESDVSIEYDRDFSLEKYLQGGARNYRGGSEMHKKVTHYRLVARGTLDEVIYNAREGKQDVAEALLAWANKDA